MPWAEFDGGLAADRGIDLGQQAGRDLHVVETAAHHRRRETAKVADHAAAERDDKIAAFDARADNRFADLFENGKTLGAFAGRNDDAVRLHAGTAERLCDRGQDLPRDVFVGDDECLGARPQRGDALAERIGDAAPDHDVIAARAEIDLYELRLVGGGCAAKGCGHAPSFGSVELATFRCAASAATISPTIDSCGVSRDCTVRSASA